LEVKVRYLSWGIAKSFGSSEKVETIDLSGEAKYQDVLHILEEKLTHHGEQDEELLDTFVLLCDGRVLHRIKDETLNPNCKILVGYADFGG
jgi:hypothetical protein